MASKSAVKPISDLMKTHLKRKVFKNIPHNLLTQFSDKTIKNLPEGFIKELPTAPAGVIKVTLTKSPNHCEQDVKGTIKALGLQKMHHYIFHKNTPEIRGMIHKARVFIRVDEIPINN
ncbi:hypothetical protein DICPUDRAFT_155439 [Dictyostelium purpureum]|uniref:Large ribosomal subunit protein uL30m n=1 Tax=Dictyostelium purpureum TaxID=5786 RepID=F0ZU10_DICPU|nr:uncharacterized protein DICPUDRAFT_155439 [Dictyostelium purpureum]EGC32574.1 hypothetical protein DICPUDRAFT_155439 [Dictyostelium purpureum]|eukprot:XP_003290911.1 hypothetical protein DICPUDRAFT_155439 [Dictyostelium purpureum]